VASSEPGNNSQLVELEGSEGEGGGQILRSALSASLITGRPFRISRIRAHRDPPGLRPQHLACVRGAEAISHSRSEGAQVGSEELTFSPGPVKAGCYVLEIGTAGSAPLLFQCLYFPLALSGPSELTLRGGTHVRNSPSFHYLAWIWLPAMRMFGLRGEVHLRRAGFYPEGAGEFRAVISPNADPPSSLRWPARGTLREMEVTSFVGSLPFDIAERQTKAAVAALREIGIYCLAENLPLPAAPSAGTAVFIRAQFENTTAGFGALGERGKPAEEVGQEAARQVAEFMESGGAVDEHLGDQLLVPASLLAAGRLGNVQPATTEFAPAKITSHLLTNASVLQRFLPIRVDVSPSGRVQIAPASSALQP